jgi:hypothetical protein
MASAAAVSADIDRPPIENDLDESGGVTSTIIPNKPEEEDDDDEDEDIQRKGRRQDRSNQAIGDDEDPGTVDDDDLFGDDGEEELPDEPAAEWVTQQLAVIPIADNPPAPLDESLMTRTSIPATMMADWTAVETRQWKRSRKCKSRRRLSWISTFPDKQDPNPVTARYANLSSRYILPY